MSLWLVIVLICLSTLTTEILKAYLYARKRRKIDERARQWADNEDNVHVEYGRYEIAINAFEAGAKSEGQGE